MIQMSSGSSCALVAVPAQPASAPAPVLPLPAPELVTKPPTSVEVPVDCDAPVPPLEPFAPEPPAPPWLLVKPLPCPAAEHAAPRLPASPRIEMTRRGDAERRRDIGLP